MELDAEKRPRAMHTHVPRSPWLWCALMLLALSGASLVAFASASDVTATASSARARAGNPLATLVRDATGAKALVGRVEERLAAGSYSYHAVRLDRDGSTRWAVTLGKGVPPGTRVSVRSFGRRSEFYSARLKRTFAELVFGIVSRLD